MYTHSHPLPPTHHTQSPSQSSSILQYLLNSTQQHAEHSLLDVVVAMDGGSEGVGQHLKRIVLLATRESLDLGHVTTREERGHLLREGDDVGGQEHRAEGAGGVARTLGGKTAVVTNDLDSITRLREKDRKKEERERQRREKERGYFIGHK